MTDIIKLYHPKHRSVREAAVGSMRLAQLKRAGYRIGKLPPLPKAKDDEPEKLVIDAVEGADEQDEKREPVMAEHAPVIPEDEASDDEEVEEISKEEAEGAEEEVSDDEEVAEEEEADEASE